MLESKDILLFVLAFCVLWFTLFISWLIWQVATMLKNFNEVLTEAKDKLNKMERAITAMKERFEKATSSVGLVAKGVEKIITYAIEKKKREEKEE